MSTLYSPDHRPSAFTDEEAEPSHQPCKSYGHSIPTPPATCESSTGQQHSATQEQGPYTASLSRETSSSGISNSSSSDGLAHSHDDSTMAAPASSATSRKRQRSHGGCSERSSGSSSHATQPVTAFAPRRRDFVKSKTWSSVDLRTGTRLPDSPASVQQARNVVHASPNNLFSPSKARPSMPFRRHHSSAAVLAGPRSNAPGSANPGKGSVAPGLTAEGFGIQVLPDGQVRPYVRRNVLQMVFRGTRLWTHEPIYYEDSETSHSSGGEEDDDDDEDEDDWNIADELLQEGSQSSAKRSKTSSASFDWRQYGDYFGGRPPTTARGSGGPPTTPPPFTSHADQATAARGQGAAEPPRVKDQQQDAKRARRLMARREWENNRLANPRLKPKRLFVKEIREVERRKLRETQPSHEQRTTESDQYDAASTSADALFDPDWVLGRIMAAPANPNPQQRHTIKPTIASQHGQITPPRSQESQQHEAEAQRKRFDSAMTLEGSDDFLDARSWDPPSADYAHPRQPGNAGWQAGHAIAQQNAFSKTAAPAYQRPWPAAAAPAQSHLYSTSSSLGEKRVPPPQPWTGAVHDVYQDAHHSQQRGGEGEAYASDEIHHLTHQSDRKVTAPRTIYNVGRSAPRPSSVAAGSREDGEDVFLA